MNIKTIQSHAFSSSSTNNQQQREKKMEPEYIEENE